MLLKFDSILILILIYDGIEDLKRNFFKFHKMKLKFKAIIKIKMCFVEHLNRPNSAFYNAILCYLKLYNEVEKHLFILFIFKIKCRLLYVNCRIELIELNLPLGVARGDGRLSGRVGLLRLLQKNVVENSEKMAIYFKTKTK